MLKRRFSLILTLVLLATAFRLYQIQTQSIWFDEGWSAYAAAQPTLDAAWRADPTNPPLYYVLLNLAAHAFGTSEFALRFASLLLGLPLIPLVFQLARRVARSERAGRYAALLTALSAPLWWASQEARMYTLLALLVVICALAWQIIIMHPRRATWIALWLGELALLYAHNTGPIAAIWLNVVTLLVCLVTFARTRRLPRFSLRVWIGGQIVVGLLWLPYFLQRFVLLQAANSAVTSAPQIGLPLLAEIWAGIWVAPWALAIKGLPAFILTLALIAVVVLVIFRTMLRRAFWLLAHVVLLTAGLVAGLIALGNDLHGRYLVMVVPLGLAAVGIGLAGIRWRWLRSLLALPFVLLFAFDLIVAQNPDYQHDDARGMVQVYADHLTAADSVIAWSYADRYELAYYWDRLGAKAKRITLPEGADLDAVLPLLPTSGDVALNVWYTQRADYRGMLGCVLGNGTVDAPDSYTTYGMTSLIYHQPTLELPALHATDLVFTDSGAAPVAQVIQLGQIPAASADHALCLPIQLILQRHLNADLKAKLIVQNDLGWTVASADAIFATANQRTSSVLTSGDSLTAYPLLRLPYGAPVDAYRVYLRLYDETLNPSGYNPPQSGQALSGRDVLVGTWAALPGADWAAVKRAPDLPNKLALSVSGDLKLIGHNLPLAGIPTAINGDEIPVTLLWQGTGALPDLELSDDGGAWNVSAPTHLSDHGAITLDWRSIRIPVDAPSGTATLRIGASVILAHYRIQSLPLLTSAPPFDHPIQVTFPNVGDLVGYSLDAAPFSRDNPPALTLIWRAGDQAPSISYTVFAQLLNAQGQVIAQSDSIPGNRPTTGWRAGEYIADPETLTFNANASPGTTKLIVGLYDAQTGVRVRLADGSDSVTLTTAVEVR